MRTKPPHGPEADDAPLLRGALRAGANWRLPVPDFLAALLSEFRRAVAAEQRYEDLKRMDASTFVRHGLTSAGIARNVFEEVYSCASEGGGEAWVSAELALQGYPPNRANNEEGPSGVTQPPAPVLALSRYLEDQARCWPKGPAPGRPAIVAARGLGDKVS